MIKSLKSLGTYDGSDVGADTRPVSSRNTNETLRRTMSSLTTQKGYKTRVVDIWALGITVVIGGQYFNWNDGLSAGFGSYAIATLLIGTAYICLCFCTSELSSALPFAGGGYGLARVTLGFYAGFMVGCCEIMEYIIYTADTCLSLNDLIVQAAGMDRKFSPLIWLFFYITAVTVHCVGGKVFWRVSNTLAFLSITIIIMYCLGSLQFTDFRNAKQVAHVSSDNILFSNSTVTILLDDHLHIEPAWFIGGGFEFMRVLPLAGWMYVGIETLNFASNDITEPRKNIPTAVMLCIAALVTTSVAVLFISSSLPPGNCPLAFDSSPLSRGFELMFKINDISATWLSIPATYATGFGFIFSYGRLMLAMSESRLLPRILRIKWGSGNGSTPSLAFIMGSSIGFIVCIFVYFFPSIQKHLFNICILFAFGAYTSQFVGFLYLRTRFIDLPRLYYSPLGITGAILGTIIFTLAAISVVAFQKDGYTAFIAVLIIAAVNSMYYFCSAKHHQKFSRDELKTLFNAHVFKLGSVSNKSRLERAKKSAKRTFKRSYDSDRNSYSGEQGDYKRNSSESLNAAMRSVVQRDREKRERSLERVEENDEMSQNVDFDLGSISGGTQPGQVEPNFEATTGSNDKLVTPALKMMAVKSLPSFMRNPSNRKVVTNVTPIPVQVTPVQVSELDHRNPQDLRNVALI